MSTDYLSNLMYRGLIPRIKRISDATIADGRKLYRHIDIGIEPNWFLVFGILLEHEESNVSQISSILHFAHPSVIAIVRKMEHAGYLHIVASTSDKRKQIIRLSDKAIKQLPEMQKIWNACEIAIESLFMDDGFIIELKKMETALKNESFFERVMRNLAENSSSEDELTILPFEPEDAREFGDLNKEWINKYFILEAIDELVLDYPQEQILEKGGCIFMAKIGGRTAGTFALQPKAEKVELSKMAVNPIFRNKGIGKKLIEKSIDQAKMDSYQTLILYSNRKLTAAIHLYRKYGFVEVPVENDVKYTRADIKMELKLTSSRKTTRK